jgi:hypothetical protein
MVHGFMDKCSEQDRGETQGVIKTLQRKILEGGHYPQVVKIFETQTCTFASRLNIVIWAKQAEHAGAVTWITNRRS